MRALSNFLFKIIVNQFTTILAKFYCRMTAAPIYLFDMKDEMVFTLQIT